MTTTAFNKENWFPEANNYLDRKINGWKPDWLLPHQSSYIGRIELGFISPKRKNILRAVGKVFTHIAGSLMSISLELARLVGKVVLIAAKLFEIIAINFPYNLFIKPIINHFEKNTIHPQLTE
ncbi:MAG TPA: hypothetical protein P5048_02245 [Chlamydiales bacterium]|nr:hypothetical protein [Chlamydiales bacterium]